MKLAPVRVSTRTPSVARRWRLLGAATLAVALCAGYPSVTMGHRLDHGSSWWHGADAETLTEGPRTEIRFAFSPRGQITFGASIRNPGPWPVTITGVAVNDGPADQHVFKVVRLAVNHTAEANAMFDPDAATPFRSMRVGAGTELPVFVTITIPDVEMAPGSGLFFDNLAVAYTVLGLPRHQRVPMGFRLSVLSPDGYVPDDARNQPRD
ncbi:hypothetical protein [Micromonospora chersina]|nr:hypothetical protein [Micromonospora chersina]SCL66336.1 hypothetical protein GA0070603_4169 [Micromonospora chersina]